MTRPVFAYIDTTALQHNLAVARRHAGTSRILAVIKANGYGHGLTRVAEALSDADGFAVATLEEAIRLRNAGWRKLILLLEGIFASNEIADCVAHRISLVVHQFEQIQMLKAAHLTQPLDIFLKLNSGMNRLGFKPHEYRLALEDIERMPMLRNITQISHFATADDALGIAAQLEVIERCFSESPYPVSLANSAALLRYPSSLGDWVRPGIALYGASPFMEASAASLQLLPVMTLHSKIIAVQRLLKGEALGYGHGWIADQPSRIGVVACGYADGYPRHAPTGTPILVQGQLTRTLGRVSMDMLFADITDLAAAEVGSEVILWGKGLPVETVAHAAGTISYELLCARAQRVPERDLSPSTS